MAKKKANLNLSAKLGADASKAFKDAREEEADYGSGGDLPKDVQGIAQLVDMKLDTYSKGDRKGQIYFYAAGVVVEPKKFNGVRIEGRRTSIMKPMADTQYKTQAEQIVWMQNELKKLGVDTSELDLEDVEQTYEALLEEAPYFEFETWAGEPTKEYPNPIVNHKWMGVVEDYNPEESEDDSDEPEDNTAPSKPAPTKAKGKTPTKGKGKSAPKKAPEPEPAEEEADEEEFSLAELGEQADQEDDADAALEAQTQLQELAKAHGVDSDSLETWSAVAEAVAEAQGGEGDGEEEEEAADDGEEIPAINDLVYYGEDRIECEVSAVFEKSKKCNLRNLDDKTVMKSIPWSELQYE